MIRSLVKRCHLPLLWLIVLALLIGQCLQVRVGL